MTSLELSTDQKELKNKGYYRGPTGGYHYPYGGGNDHVYFARQANTYRMVLCTANISAGEDHYLRIRCVSAKQRFRHHRRRGNGADALVHSL